MAKRHATPIRVLAGKLRGRTGTVKRHARAGTMFARRCDIYAT